MRLFMESKTEEIGWMKECEWEEALEAIKKALQGKVLEVRVIVQREPEMCTEAEAKG